MPLHYFHAILTALTRIHYKILLFIIASFINYYYAEMLAFLIGAFYWLRGFHDIYLYLKILRLIIELFVKSILPLPPDKFIYPQCYLYIKPSLHSPSQLDVMPQMTFRWDSLLPLHFYYNVTTPPERARVNMFIYSRRLIEIFKSIKGASRGKQAVFYLYATRASPSLLWWWHTCH